MSVNMEVVPVALLIEPRPNLLPLGDAGLSWAELLVDSPLRERRCRLDGVVPGELRVARGGAEVWDDTLARGHEGVMVYTVHVRPELVAEIAFDGVQLSAHYVSGFALHFARVKRYREDKPAGEADTLETVRALAPA